MASEAMSPERLQRLTQLRDERNRALGERGGSVDHGEWAIVLRLDPETGESGWDLLLWGLVPHWAKDRASPQLHARAETVHELPSFRDSFRNRRCLIFSDRFIEFRTLGKPKGQEVAFGLATGRGLVVAGIWDVWHDPETGNRLRTFADITVDANDLVGEMHDRMPAILPQEVWRTWVGQEPATELELRRMLRPFPPELLTCWSTKGKRPPPGIRRRPDESRKPRGTAPEPPRQGSLL